MKPCHSLLFPLPMAGKLLFPRSPALCFGKLLFCLSQVFRVLYLSACIVSIEVLQVYIYGNCFARLRQGSRICLGRENCKPLAGLALDCDGFDIANDGLREFDLYMSYLGQIQLAVTIKGEPGLSIC